MTFGWSLYITGHNIIGEKCTRLKSVALGKYWAGQHISNNALTTGQLRWSTENAHALIKRSCAILAC